MNRTETLEWIELILGSLDDSEMMAIINESQGQFDGEFFETIDSEMERYKAEHDHQAAQDLNRIARAIASVKQNRTEKL